MIDVNAIWYRRFHPLAYCLLPLSYLFAALVKIRRWLYLKGIFRTHHLPIPVIVVGNITVGGTGKTPFVIWLANFLQRQGYRPGIVSRGVGGIKHTAPYWVRARDCAETVGDEALLLLRHTGCPLVIARDRVAAVECLMRQSDCDIVISDDGLQHYRLGRDMEIAIIDGVRRFGNAHLLPAGPLRESISRLKTVDFVVINGGDESDTFTFDLRPLDLISLKNPALKIALSQFSPKKIHAFAAIGHPERFFKVLKNAGFDLISHVFPDHYHYQLDDVMVTDGLPIVMTEKDSVKCSQFNNSDIWYLTVAPEVSPSFIMALLTSLNNLLEKNVCCEK